MLMGGQKEFIGVNTRICMSLNYIAFGYESVSNN